MYNARPVCVVSGTLLTTLLITGRYTNYDICKPECPNEVVLIGDGIYETNSDRYTECVGHYDISTYQKMYPIPNTILRGPAYVESEE